MKIIVFDSGIGGFSIVREIRSRQLPFNIEYFCDQKYFPYGSKSNAWLADRLSQIGDWARRNHPDAFVLACNTGTVAGIEELRRGNVFPVVGVEPVIKPLASYERALILMTPAAAEAKRTHELIRIYGPHVQIYGCDGLAQAIEDNDSVQVKKKVNEIGIIVQKEHIQVIGLSCTHYPLISSVFAQAFPAVHLYDPSRAVVHQLERMITVDEKSTSTGHMIFQTTGSVVRFNEQVRRYFGDEYHGEKIRL